MSTKSVLRQVPFFRLLIPLIVGIVLFELLQPPVFFCFTICFLTFIFLITAFFLRSYQNRWLTGFACSLFLISVGLSLTAIKRTKNNFDVAASSKQEFLLIALEQDPIETAKTFRAEVKILQKRDNDWIKINSKALIYLAKDSLAKSLKMGDMLIVPNRFEEIVNRGNPYEFDARQYYANKTIYKRAYLRSNDWAKCGNEYGNPLLLAANNARNLMLALMRKQGITGDEYAVLSALTLGYTNDIDDDTKQAYKVSGTMHVLSVSGLHVGLIYGFICMLLGFLDRKPKQRAVKAVVTILLIWAYSFIAGLPPSVMRSAFMFSILIAGQAMLRQTNIYNTLCASAFILLLGNPILIEDIGFQLSYLAVAGIAFFNPKLYSLFTFKNYLADKIYELVTVSLSAQLATLPLCLFYFGQFPNYFLLANIVVVPLTTFILYFAIAMFAFSWLLPLAKILAWICGLLVHCSNYVVTFIEKLPYAALQTGDVSWIQSVLIYIFIALVAAFFIQKENRHLRYAFTTIALLLALSVYNEIQIKKRQVLIVYNYNNTPVIEYISGHQSTVFTDSVALPQNIEREMMNRHQKMEIDSDYIFSFRNSRKSLTNNEFMFFKWQSKKIVLVSENKKTDFSVKEPVEVDYLIICGYYTGGIDRLKQLFRPEKIIASSAVYKKKEIRYWEQQAQKHTIPVYIVTDSGAYIEHL
jgi:competence protein ComEC